MTDQLKDLNQVLHDNGYRLTAPRRAILTALVTSNEHPSADELCDLVQQIAPGVGRMTVYRTLDLLTALGVVRPVHQGTAAARFVILDRGRHHHFVCSGCDMVIEFEECVLHEVGEAISEHYNFLIEGHLLEVYGRCQNCR